MWKSISFFFLISSSIAIELEITCQFSLDDFKAVGEIYTCESQNFLTSEESENLTATFDVTNHLPTSTNPSVKGFKIDGHSLKTFPQSIEKTFTNLIAIYINDGLISKITQDDLKVFPLLRYLDLFANHIEVIEKDLFKFNSNLEVIWLSDNKISLVDSKVFDHLNKLTNLYLMDNICISRSESNRTEVLKLITQVKNDCSKAIPTTSESPRFKTYSQLQRDLIDYASKLKKFEEDLNDAHFAMELMKVAAEIKNLHFEAELEEVREELKKVEHKKNILIFFVVVLCLALVGVGVLYYRRRPATSEGYARSFLI